MKTFKDFVTEDPTKLVLDSESMLFRSETDFLIDTVYSHYIDEYNKNSVECVGWLDGHENSLIRFQKIYEAGIDDNDSVLDVGCGVAHLHTYLNRKGWNGQYLGFDPNKKAIDLIDENINTMCGTIDRLPDFMKYDWVIANGTFNLGLTEEHTFWIIENMISHANKGIIFNMFVAPYEDPNYVAYDPEQVKFELRKYDHRKIEIIEGYMDDAEFTVYFYKENE
jgi:hypothetical protein